MIIELLILLLIYPINFVNLSFIETLTLDEFDTNLKSQLVATISMG